MLHLVLAVAITGALAGNPSQPALRAELLKMQAADQQARNGNDPGKMDVVDPSNTARLQAIIARYGWPGRTLVGQDGAAAAWLVAQHADRDVAFQVRCLALLEDAVRREEADPKHLAYLMDRVAVNQNRPQTYGTQFETNDEGELVPKPIKDAAHVDERRATVGLDTLAEYKASLLRVAVGGSKPVKDPALRKQLLEMYAADQAAMQENFTGYVRSSERRERLERFAHLVYAGGWPDAEKVGLAGQTAAVHLAYEVDDVPLLELCLSGLKAAHARGKASGRDLAWLTDHWLVKLGKKQRYGTNFTWIDGVITPTPIEDEAHVDERRAELGLQPLAEAVTQMRRNNPAKQPKP
jgi:hypothetical protein